MSKINVLNKSTECFLMNSITKEKLENKNGHVFLGASLESISTILGCDSEIV